MSARLEFVQKPEPQVSGAQTGSVTEAVAVDTVVVAEFCPEQDALVVKAWVVQPVVEAPDVTEQKTLRDVTVTI